MNKHLYIVLTCAIALCAYTCTPDRIAGGTGEETTNGRVYGTVTDSLSLPVKGAVVMLLKTQYDPVREVDMPRTITTDNEGRFDFSAVDTGTYNVRSFVTGRALGAMTSRITVHCDTTQLDTLKLEQTGVLHVKLPSTVDGSTGYVYIPGTGIYANATDNTGWVQLDSVPAGNLPSVAYSSSNTSTASVIRFDITVMPGQPTTINNPDWLYARRIELNTTPSGADVAGDVKNFPILIRLREENFMFDRASKSGEDIRFTKEDNTPLQYEIESFDATAKHAEIWVKMDTVRGNNSTQSLLMYWGNANAASQSSASAVFDTSAGFAGVWHLGSPVAEDATVNALNGTATATSTVPGVIGMAQMFNGTSSMIQVTGSSNDKLNFPDSGTYSVSAWVKTNVLDSLFHGVVYKSDFQYGLQMRPFNEWEFVTYIDKSRWEMSRTPALDNSWHAIVGVRSGSNQYLYFDGVCVDSSVVIITYNSDRVYNQPLEIGHCPDVGTNPDRFFNGAIDEVRIAGIAYSADWIKLCYMNQKENDVLVKW